MYIKVKEGETAQELALRLGCPLCMLLRANGVLSGVWLEMRSEVRVPEADECRMNPFPCPNAFSKGGIPEKTGYIVRGNEDADMIACTFRLPRRIVTVNAPGGITEGKAIYLPDGTEQFSLHTVGIYETWKNFENPYDLMLLNMHYTPLYPGMKILIRRT